MRKALLLGIIIFLYLPLLAQNNYRTYQSGNWNDANTWQEEVGGVWTNPAPGGAPDYNDGTVIIRSNHTVNITSSTTIDQTVISVLAQVIIDMGVSVTVANGTANDVEISDDGFDFGTLTVNGTLDLSDGANINNATNSTVYINGTYINNDSGPSSTIIGATWGASSTCEIRGVTTTSTIFANLNQSFGNFVYNCVNQESTAVVDFNGGFASNTIQGNLSILSTGSSSGTLRLIGNSSNHSLSINGSCNIIGASRVIWGFGSGTNNTVTILGNFIHSSTGSFLFCQNGDITFNISGDFVKSGSSTNFNFSSGSGSTTINVNGNFTNSAGIITETGSGNLNTINFNGPSTYTGGGSFANSINFNIGLNGDLNLNSYSLNGAGNFTLTGKLRVGSIHASGAIQSSGTNGNIIVSGTRTYNNGSTISYNGTAAQFMGNGFPNSGGVNLEVDNTSNVNLSSSTSINNLILTSGRLIISSNTLTINGNISNTSGYLSSTNLSDLTINGTGSAGTIPFDNGSTQLKNFTLNRSGSATLGSNIELVGLLDLEAGDLFIDDRTLTLSGTIDNSTGTNSGFLSGNTNTQVVIQGTGAFGEVNFQQTGGNSIHSLTLNRSSSGSATIGNDLTINNTLSLSNGTLSLDPTESLTMASGSTISRQASGSMSFIAQTPATYNVLYTGSTAMTTGSELPTTTDNFLNNLTVSTSNTITLDKSINVRGNLSITNGTLSTSTSNHNISLEGNFTNAGIFNANNSTITYSGTSAQTIGRATYHNLSITGAGLKTLEGTTAIDATGVLTLGGGDIALGGRTLTINNSSPSAIVRTSGNIRSENTSLASILAWNIGTTNGTFSFPFGNSSGSALPFILSNVNGSDLGTLSVATYPTDNLFSNTPTTNGAADIRRNGADNRNNTIKRFWQINRSTSGSINVNATFSFPSTDDPIALPEDLRMQRWNGTGWDAPLAGQTYTASNPRTIMVPGITSFSPWAGSDASEPLPVSLSKFEATLVDNHVNLDWTTLSEIRSSHFTIERSEQSDHFYSIGKIISAGFSDITNDYSFQDKSVSSLHSDYVYYRLKQVDIDGNFKIYPAKAVFIGDLKRNSRIKIHPNPAYSHVTVTSSNEMPTVLTILNALGDVVVQDQFEGEKRIDVSQLPKGVYFFKCSNESGTENKKVVIE